MIIPLVGWEWCSLPSWARSTSWVPPSVAVLLIYEHALIRPHDFTRVNVAFFQVNIVISMGLLVVAVVDLLM